MHKMKYAREIVQGHANTVLESCILNEIGVSIGLINLPHHELAGSLECCKYMSPLDG